MYREAKADFAICVNLDHGFSQAYLARAKCEFDEGN
jgi:hypothetical protein